MNARQYTIVNNRIVNQENGQEAKGDSLADADLSTFDLRGVNLDNLDLRNVNLERATLCNASIKGTIFYDAILDYPGETIFISDCFKKAAPLKDALVDPSILSKLSLNQISETYIEVQEATRESFVSKYTIMSGVFLPLNYDIRSVIVSFASNLYWDNLKNKKFITGSSQYIHHDLLKIFRIAANETFWKNYAGSSTTHEPLYINEIKKSAAVEENETRKIGQLTEKDFCKWKRVKEIAKIAEKNCPSLIALSFYKAISTHKVEKFSTDYSSKLTPTNPG